MASIETDARIRIADGLVVIGLSIISLFMIWGWETTVWLGVVKTVMAVILLISGVFVLIGRARTGKLVLTRRRWKYFALGGLVVVSIIVFVASTMLTARAEGNPALSLFPLLVGLILAQLFESEASARYKPSDLSEHDLKVWKRNALVLAIIGVVLGCIAGTAGAVGNLDMLALLGPIGILFLVFAAVIWVMLRKRNRRLRAKG